MTTPANAKAELFKINNTLTRMDRQLEVLERAYVRNDTPENWEAYEKLSGEFEALIDQKVAVQTTSGIITPRA